MIIVHTKDKKFELQYHKYNKISYILFNDKYKFGISPECGFFKPGFENVIIDGIDQYD